ncbi:MAG: GntP family permease [Tannerella sp.]|jgi:Gnt-I system high-affinity gluconate transporter|nr:GntP family permease [Tannerella sp.]
MTILAILLCLLALILFISYFKVDAFLSLVIISIVMAVLLGVPLGKIPSIVEKGVGNILGNLTLTVVFGAMLGKLIAESGAAQKIAEVMANIMGIKNIQWGLMITGFIVGIPLFYNVGFVLMVPIIFSVVYQYKFPAVYVGLPMLASMSVTHGFLPPHPSPVALVSMLNANMGVTLILGIVVAIPAVIVAGPVFSKTLKDIKTGPLKLFDMSKADSDPDRKKPGKANSFLSATLPVFLLIIVTAIPYFFPGKSEFLSFISAPLTVMLLSLIVATYTLGIRQGRSVREIMLVYSEAVKDISMILLIIAGSGIFKEVMETSGVSLTLAAGMEKLPVHPLILGWMIAGLIRVCIGSATVSALTAAGVVMPLVAQSGINPNLMVLSLGAGSLLFSHVNDSGFWMFKEYFNVSVKDTLRSWSVMEIIVSVVGLAGVLVLNALM